MPFLKRTALVLFLIISSIFVGALLIELMLRLDGFTYPSWEVRDRDVGFVGLPGAEGAWRAEGNQGYVVFNSHGFRDKERSISKPDNVIRVAVLGDSFVQAREVKPDQTFTVVAEKELEKCTNAPGVSFEVLNFGVSAYNTAAELALLRQRVWGFDPDIVLLAFFVGNDVQGNHPKMDYFKDISGIGIPLFEMKDGELQLVRSYLNDPVYVKRLESPAWRLMLSLINKSAFLQFMNYTRHNLKPWLNTFLASWKKPETKAQPKEETPRAVGHWIGMGTNDAMFPPKNETWEEAWRLTEAGITAMAREVRQRQGEFWLMLIPHPPQVHWDENGTPPLYPQNRLAALAGRLDAPFVDLYPDFRSRYLEDKTYLFGFEPDQHGDGHWNPKGHELAASVLSRRLCDGLAQSKKN